MRDQKKELLENETVLRYLSLMEENDGHEISSVQDQTNDDDDFS